VFSEIRQFHAAHFASVRGALLGKARHGAIAASLMIVASGSTLTPTFARQQELSVDSFRVVNATAESVDVELTGTNDGSMGQLCLRTVAKSKYGDVRSPSYASSPVPSDRKFHAFYRIPRPNGVARQVTNYLLVTIYPCTQDVVLRRKFDFHYVWPERTPGATGDEQGNNELGETRPWLAFYANLQDEDYEALDGLLQKWNDPKERDQNGNWKLDGFRSAFEDYSTRRRDWKAELQYVRRWREFNPWSAGAAIAEAKYWTAYAWYVRGGAVSSEPDPVALKVFGERMQRAEQILKDAKEFAADNPLWYEGYLNVADATGHSEDFIDALFDEATRTHPYFQPIYLAMAKHWAPRSGQGADWKKVDEVVRRAMIATVEADGKIDYAMLYARISDFQCCLRVDILRDSLVSWSTMRDSFDELVERYPSADNLNEFAAFACRALDKDTYLRLRARIIDRIRPIKWPGNYSIDLCDHRFLERS
jgi:hypothetical protein